MNSMKKEEIKKKILEKVPSSNLEAFQLLIDYIDASVEEVFSEEE